MEILKSIAALNEICHEKVQAAHLTEEVVGFGSPGLGKGADASSAGWSADRVVL